MRQLWMLTMTLTLAAAAACTSSEAPVSPGEPQFPDPPAGAVSVQFQNIDEAHTAFMSGITQPERVVIRTQNEWAVYWDAFQGTQLPKTDPPTVDFDQEMVVAAAMGTRNTGGYGVTINDVLESHGMLIVRVVESSPGPRCATVQVITAPATAVTIPKSDDTVEFQAANVINDCA